ncbi:hypothetical protein GCM10027190_29720 [Spirosoma areae]
MGTTQTAPVNRHVLIDGHSLYLSNRLHHFGLLFYAYILLQLALPLAFVSCIYVILIGTATIRMTRLFIADKAVPDGKLLQSTQTHYFID